MLRKFLARFSLFLFSSMCRGPAGEWYEALTGLLRQSKTIRLWFAQNVLFAHPERISEYLLESPTTEVRYNRRIFPVCCDQNFKFRYI